MRGTTIFVLASFFLPAFAGPVPVQDTVSLGMNTNIEQRASVIADTKDSRDLHERTPIIEAIPVEVRSPIDAETITTRTSTDTDGEHLDAGDHVERGIQRTKGGWGRGITRTPGGWGRRSNDNVERGIQRTKGGWKRGITRPNGGWPRSSNDNVERGIQRGGKGW